MNNKIKKKINTMMHKSKTMISHIKFKIIDRSFMESWSLQNSIVIVRYR